MQCSGDGAAGSAAESGDAQRCASRAAAEIEERELGWFSELQSQFNGVVRRLEWRVCVAHSIVTHSIVNTHPHVVWTDAQNILNISPVCSRVSSGISNASRIG